MKKLLYTLLFVLCAAPLMAQTFSVTHTDTIPDDNSVVSFDVVVSGLPSVIDTNFGLELACINMLHTYCSDMEVKLEAPDGTTVLLFSGIGGGDDDFINTCMGGTGTPITQANAPFTGTFKAQGPIGSVNNGQNPNGTWHLLCRDMAGADIGILSFWSIRFGTDPAFPFIFSSSNLPIVKLTTVGAAIGDDPKVPVLMQIIDNGPGMRNYTNQTNYAYVGTIMAEWQGFSGPAYPKKNFDFESVDGLGQNLDTTLLGQPREHDWIFKAEYLDHTLIKNMLTYEMARRMGGYAARTSPCEIILDGEYIGYYSLTEKMKRDTNRIDIAKLTGADLSGVNLTGGYIVEMNITGDPGSWNSNYPPINNATCGLPVEFKYVYPRANVIAPVQGNYIHAYIDSFENVMQSPNFDDPVNGYRKFVNIETFMDFLIVNEFSVNYDSYGRSTFMYKEKATDGGKLKIGPPWDYDRALDYDDPGRTSGWVWEITHQGWPFPFWWSKWWTEDDYRHQLACRWTSLRQSTLSNNSFLVLIDSLSNQIHEAAERNFTIWNELGGASYDDQIDSLRSYLTRRLAWMDAEFALENIAQPIFYLPTDTTVCAGAVYDAGFNGPQYNYNWQPGPDSALITLLQSGPVTLEVTDDFGCQSHKEMDVTISQPNPAFVANQVANGLSWSFVPANQQAQSYAWDFGDGGTSTLSNPSHTYASGGTYTVQLAIVDSIGCTDAGTQNIQFVYVGSEDMASLNGEIYPNPFTDRLDIALALPAKTKVELALHNELGQVLLAKTYPAGTRTIALTTTDLPAGIYLLRVSIGDRTAVRKVVKW